MIHGNEGGFARFSRTAATLGAASLALSLGATALLVSTDSVAGGGSGKVPAGCVAKCDRRLADTLAFCARTAEWLVVGNGATADGEVSACEARAAGAHEVCVASCGVPGDPY